MNNNVLIAASNILWLAFIVPVFLVYARRSVERLKASKSRARKAKCDRRALVSRDYAFWLMTGIAFVTAGSIPVLLYWTTKRVFTIVGAHDLNAWMGVYSPWVIEPMTFVIILGYALHLYPVMYRVYGRLGAVLLAAYGSTVWLCALIALWVTSVN